jgi:hypothetical protein
MQVLRAQVSNGTTHTNTTLLTTTKTRKCRGRIARLVAAASSTLQLEASAQRSPAAMWGRHTTPAPYHHNRCVYWTPLPCSSDGDVRQSHTWCPRVLASIQTSMPVVDNDLSMCRLSVLVCHAGVIVRCAGSPACMVLLRQGLGMSGLHQHAPAPSTCVVVGDMAARPSTPSDARGASAGVPGPVHMCCRQGSASQQGSGPSGGQEIAQLAGTLLRGKGQIESWPCPHTVAGHSRAATRPSREAGGLPLGAPPPQRPPLVAVPATQLFPSRHQTQPRVCLPTGR